jgi:hypothetical protein
VKLKIAISSDLRGFGYNASLIASVVRRASVGVHVRCWCRGFSQQSFETGHLKVEFIEAAGEIPGRFPGYVGPAVFDRLRVIRDCPDWDRCLIMDYDQVAFCDLAPLFEMDLGDRLLAAKMQGPGVDLAFAMREWIRRPIPDGWEDAAEHPYFSMGPLLNLAEMRKAGTWEKLMAAQEAFQADENLALVAATEGRTMDFDRKWNLFPPHEVSDTELPDGVVHWLGWPKPWHEDSKVWRPELWESERCSWEHLRMGLWEKPVAVEVEPDDDHGVEELLKRGWKVRLFSGREGAAAAELPGFRYPDLEIRSVERRGEFAAGLEDPVNGGQLAKPDRVRFGSSVMASEWLAGCAQLPEHVILRGPVPRDEVRRVLAMGYGELCPIRHGEWPAGGPMARVLDYAVVEGSRALDASEEWYLRWSGPPVAGDGRDPESARGAGAMAKIAQAPGESVTGRKVAVVLTACGAERRHLPFLLEGIRKNFLPWVEKRVFVFGDGVPMEAEDVTWIRVDAVEAERVPLERFRWLLGSGRMLAGYDFVFLLKPQVRVKERVEAAEVLSGEMVAVLHAAYEGEPRSKTRFEENKASVAWIAPGEGRHYYCGSWQGGSPERLLAALRLLVEWMGQDEAAGVTPVWGDESYWNRYWADVAPGRVLGAEFAWRAGTKTLGGRIPRMQVLVAGELKKDEKKMARPARQVAVR